MAKTICKAKKLGEVRERGKLSLEWREEDGTPHYYCYGYKEIYYQHVEIAETT